MNLLISISGSATLLFLVFQMINSRRLFKHLKEEHSSLFERIGKPDLVKNPTLGAGFRTLRFVWSPLESLAETRLKQLVRFERWIQICVLASFLVATTSILATLFTH